MCEPSESTQVNSWLYAPASLDECRTLANRNARRYLASGEPVGLQQVEKFAVKFKGAPASEDDGPWTNGKGHAFLNPAEEALLVSFYASKLPNLIGPLAQVPRLRRESKVTATAALLFRRFFLSNSVMMFDPKAIMVAAAFLASKVEDATTDVRYLEEGTNLMNAPVTQAEIIPSELYLLSGIDFDLLCFHPYKAVLSITEDLRTYLKSDKGRSLVSTQMQRPIIGQDLKPMHDAAQQLVNDVIVSDIPLLYTPGQIGLAALIVANSETSSNAMPPPGGEVPPQIDLIGYLTQRFEGEESARNVQTVLRDVCEMIRGLKNGQYGCGNHNVDLQALKNVHKKLKKCRAWGQKEKKKKRKNEDGSKDPDSKKAKLV